MNIKEKIDIIRNLLKKYSFAGYLLSTSDEYFNEYSIPSSARLRYITGFTGSNGTVIVCPKHVLFFTDGRYIEQASKELDSSIFNVFDQKLLKNFIFTEYLSHEDKVAFDPKIFTRSTLDRYFSGLNLVSFHINLIDEIWQNRPLKPNSTPYLYDINYSGENAKDKVEKCRKLITKHGAQGLIIHNSENVSWLLNIRSNDLEFCTIILAKAIITLDKIYLFTDNRDFKNIKNLDIEITILEESSFEDIIYKLSGSLLCDTNNCSVYLKNLVESRDFIKLSDPCTFLKAVKNDIEIDNLKKIHIQDSVAVCNFLHYLSSSKLDDMTEYGLDEILTNFRKKSKNYVKNSFPTICGYQENSSVIHYRAQERSSKKLTNSGILLIDSGGHYLGGTTDITRTIYLGNDENYEQKYFYTKVLKGNIALSMLKFPKFSVSGSNIDAFARQYLWQDYKDYDHGTGHGVGNFLNVHEGPQSINLTNNVILEKNMVLSNEPGYYRAGKFGIRIENLMYISETENSSFLQFNTLNLVPYAKNMILFEMLNKDEMNYLNEYYRRIKEQIYHLLGSPTQKWLESEISIN